jgi:NTP pyrophosphatase (non-canonical NTP hydrolase)
MFTEPQKRVDAWISQFEEGYWKPLANLARLMEEVGELSREINHRFGEKPKKASEADTDLGEELADVLFVVIAMANSLQIDLDEAFDRVMKKYESRDAQRWTRKER